MESLPREIAEEILSYCSRGDLLNLCCCSRKYYALTKGFYWSKVNITFCGCRKFVPHGLGNLSMTRQLHLWNDWYKDPPEPGINRWRQCLKCTGMREQGDSNAIRRAQFISEVGLARIVGACDGDMVHCLSLHNVSTEGQHQALDRLRNVWKLEMFGTVHCDYTCMIALQNLRSLTLTLNKRDPSVNEGFKNLLLLNRLRSLKIYSSVNKTVVDWISYSDRLTDLFLMNTGITSLEPLSALKNLKSIHLQSWDSTTPVSVAPLAALKDLRSMTLLGYSYHGRSLQKFCQELKYLHSMVLTCADVDLLLHYPVRSYIDGYVLRDSDFAEIAKLSCLKELFLSGKCSSLNGSCFRHISKLKSLEKISMRIDERADMLVEKFLLLNTMPSLRRVFVSGREEVAKPIVDAILNGKKWKIQRKTDMYFGENERWQETSYTLTL